MPAWPALLLLLLLPLLPLLRAEAAGGGAERCAGPGCAGAEGQPCGGRGAGGARGPRCGAGLVCVSGAGGAGLQGAGLQGAGRCACEERGAVCGSDGRSYRSVCALRETALRGGGDGRRVRKAHDGECRLAPVIVVAPKKIHNVTGAQVSLSCEVKAVPTPVITWRKVSESPRGVKLMEELPGDRVNMAVQVRGGPSQHEGTAWVLINPLTKEDEGTYQCHATNTAGEAHADGSITVIEQDKSKKASLLAWDNLS